jgi:hypothetical protein
MRCANRRWSCLRCSNRAGLIWLAAVVFSVGVFSSGCEPQNGRRTLDLSKIGPVKEVISEVIEPCPNGQATVRITGSNLIEQFRSALRSAKVVDKRSTELGSGDPVFEHVFQIVLVSGETTWMGLMWSEDESTRYFLPDAVWECRELVPWIARIKHDYHGFSGEYWLDGKRQQ